MYESLDTLTDRKNLYEKVTRMDLVGKIRPLLDHARWAVRPDGKIENQRMEVAWETPWIHNHQRNNNECTLWHAVYFKYFKRVSSHCSKCWKVCVAPRTVEELMNLNDFQKAFGHPSKCGIEIRNTSNKVYGGYFYNMSKEAGLECYKKVRERIDPKIPVVLKSGCTEFELEFKVPPCDFKQTEEDLWIENWVREWIIVPQYIFAQPRHLQAYVIKRWLHHAAMHNDETYKIFTDGNVLFKELKTYHKEKENG